MGIQDSIPIGAGVTGGQQVMNETLGLPPELAAVILKGQTTPQAPGGGDSTNKLQDILANIKQMFMQGKDPIIQGKASAIPGALPNNRSYQVDMSGQMRDPSNPFNNSHNATASLLQSIGGAIGKFKQHEDQKKAQSVQYDLTRIQTAMQNPTEENKALINEILNDPKKRKNLEKAIGINFFGEDKNSNTPERKGFKDFATKLMQQQPTVPQINPQVALEAQLTKAGLIPKAGETLGFVKSILQDDAKFRQAVTVAGMRGDAETAKALVDAKTKLYVEQMKVDAQTARGIVQIEIAKGHDAAMRYAADKRVEAAKQRVGGRNADDKDAKILTDSIGKNTQEISGLQKDLITAQKVLKGSKETTGIFGLGGKNPDYQAAKQRVLAIQERITELQGKNDSLRTKLSEYTGEKQNGGSGDSSEIERIIKQLSTEPDDSDEEDDQ